MEPSRLKRSRSESASRSRSASRSPGRSRLAAGRAARKALEAVQQRLEKEWEGEETITSGVDPMAALEAAANSRSLKDAAHPAAAGCSPTVAHKRTGSAGEVPFDFFAAFAQNARSNPSSSAHSTSAAAHDAQLQLPQAHSTGECVPASADEAQEASGRRASPAPAPSAGPELGAGPELDPIARLLVRQSQQARHRLAAIARLGSPITRDSVLACRSNRCRCASRA